MPDSPVGTLSRWRATHTVVAAMVTLGAILAVAVTGAPSLGWQMFFLLIGVTLIGMPHGGLDGVIGRDWLRPTLGRAWAGVFTAGYLALAAIVLGVWLAAPTVMLAAFLGISVFHFGEGDSAGPAGARRMIETIARGSLPIVLPAVFWPAEVGTLFGWLIGEGVGWSPRPWVEWASIAAVVLLPVWVGLTVRAARRGLYVAAEIPVLILLFYVAPPLLAFAVYFSVWHSARHVLGWAAGRGETLLRTVGPFYAASWLATLGAMILLSAGWWRYRDALGDTPGLVRAIFWTLSALTVPHMLLGRLTNGRPAATSPARHDATVVDSLPSTPG